MWQLMDDEVHRNKESENDNENISETANVPVNETKLSISETNGPVSETKPE